MSETVPVFEASGDTSVWCNKCGRHVESVSLETPVEQVQYPGMIFPRLQHTGEKILVVSCHGETARISSWGR